MYYFHVPDETDWEGEEVQELIKFANKMEKDHPGTARDKDRHIHLIAGYRTQGQKTEDIDITIAIDAKNNPLEFDIVSPIIDRDKLVGAKKGLLKTAFVTIEHKAHRQYEFRGKEVFVGYNIDNGALKRVSDQSRNQKFALINSIKASDLVTSDARPVLIEDLILLGNCPEKDLPVRPHSILGNDYSFNQFASTLAAKSGHLWDINKDNGVLELDAERKGGTITGTLGYMIGDLNKVDFKPQIKPAGFELEGFGTKALSMVDIIQETALTHARWHGVAAAARLDGMMSRLPVGADTVKRVQQRLDPARDAWKKMKSCHVTDTENRITHTSEMLKQFNQAHHVIRNDIKEMAPYPDQKKHMAEIGKSMGHILNADAMIEGAANEAKTSTNQIIDKSAAAKRLRDVGHPEIACDVAEIVSRTAHQNLTALTLPYPDKAKEWDLAAIEERIDDARLGNKAPHARAQAYMNVIRTLQSHMTKVPVSNPRMKETIQTDIANMEFTDNWLVEHLPGGKGHMPKTGTKAAAQQAGFIKPETATQNRQVTSAQGDHTDKRVAGMGR